MVKYFVLIFLAFLAKYVNDHPSFTEKTIANHYFSTKHHPVKIDSALGNYLRVHAYKKWKFDEVEINGDTLKIVSFSDFLYYPFGNYPNIKVFAQYNKHWGKGVLKKYFKVGDVHVYSFTKGNSLLQVLTDSEKKSVEIVKANVFDKDIFFVQPVDVGMSEIAFLNMFFDLKHLKPNVFRSIKVVKFESGILGIWNNYFFFNGKLTQITFDSDYILN